MTDGPTDKTELAEQRDAQRKLLPLPTGREKRLIAIERSIDRARAALDVARVALADLRLFDAKAEGIRGGRGERSNQGNE